MRFAEDEGVRGETLGPASFGPLPVMAATAGNATTNDAAAACLQSQRLPESLGLTFSCL